MENQNTTMTSSAVLRCPKCHSEKVRWIPYKKTPVGKTLVIWIILSCLGVSFSPIVSVAMVVLGILTVINRIFEEQ